MGNNWGIDLVDDVYYGTRSGGSKAAVEYLICSSVPGFRLHTLTESGSSANDRAIDMSTDSDHNTCLFAMGSYVGGAGLSQQWSTSKNVRLLSLVSSPDESEQKGRTNTIAFPYHVHYIGFDDDVLRGLETKCLHALDMKLTTALIGGKPYKALLFEYILSGNGRSVTDRFLNDLVPLLTRHKIVVIADKIMTGCRVGPALTMTTALPTEFQRLVAYITMGKAMRCAMVLDKVGELKSDRGTSTEIAYETVYAPLKAIIERAQSGVIQAKREKVLKAMGINHLPNQFWPDNGGLLMFVGKKRNQVMRGLKCRCLPKMEISRKTKILHAKGQPTDWNKITVNQNLMDSCRVWLAHTNMLCATTGSPYSYELAKYVLSRPLNNRIMHGSFLTYIGEYGFFKDASDLVKSHRAHKRARLGNLNGRCAKKHENLVWDVLKEAAHHSNGFISPTQVQTKRKMCYIVDYGKIV